jgi:hypothetical protein
MADDNEEEVVTGSSNSTQSKTNSKKRKGLQGAAGAESNAGCAVAKIATQQTDGRWICNGCEHAWTAEGAKATAQQSVDIHLISKEHKKGKPAVGMRKISSFFEVRGPTPALQPIPSPPTGLSLDVDDVEILDGGGSAGNQNVDDDGCSANASARSSDVTCGQIGAGSEAGEQRRCCGYRPELRDSQGGTLHIAQVYPYQRHATADDAVHGWRAATDAFYSPGCTGSVDSGVSISLDICSHCSALAFKPSLQKVLRDGCEDYDCGRVQCVRNGYLNHRQLRQKLNVKTEQMNDLRLSKFNLEKKVVRLVRKMKTWKKIQLMLGTEDVPGIRCVYM